MNERNYNWIEGKKIRLSGVRAMLDAMLCTNGYIVYELDGVGVRHYTDGHIENLKGEIIELNPIADLRTFEFLSPDELEQTKAAAKKSMESGDMKEIMKYERFITSMIELGLERLHEMGES